jgi:1-acyl-sn-glycerol-3-phosphate acyltransferase
MAYALRLLGSLWVWLVTALVVIVWLPLLFALYLATAWRDPGRYLVGLWFRRAAVAVVRLNPLWSFRTSGYRPPDPRRPYVAVANHESFADIFLVSHLPWEMKWLSKVEIFRIPVMGWLMRMAGDIAVHRGQRSSRAEALEECRDRLQKGVSVMIMPEGTRSRTEELLPFRDGAFRLAVELGLPILPMAIWGTRPALPKGSLLFGASRAEVRVLEPIPTAGLTQEEVPELRDRVRGLIAAERARLAAELDG